MLRLQLRHATAALARAKAPTWSQVRHIKLYAHIMGIQGHRFKPAKFGSLQPLPAEATTDAPPIWVRDKMVENLRDHKGLLEGHGREVHGDAALLEVPRPAQGLVRHSEDMKTGDANERMLRLYRVLLLDNQNSNKEIRRVPAKELELGNVKLLHVNPQTMCGRLWVLSLRRTYAFLEKGFMVEVHYHMLKKPNIRDMSRTVAAMRENPQAWPAVVVSAMPPGTGILIQPWTNGNVITWLMGPHEGLTRARIKHRYGSLLVRAPDVRASPPGPEERWGRHPSPGTTTPAGSPEFMYDKTETLCSAMDRLIGVLSRDIKRQTPEGQLLSFAGIPRPTPFLKKNKKGAPQPGAPQPGAPQTLGENVQQLREDLAQSGDADEKREEQ